MPAGGTSTGGDNAEVAARAATWSSSRCRGTGTPPPSPRCAEPLAGKIVVDCVNPLGFDKQGPYALTVAEGSAAQQAAALLPESRVCAAFHHVSAPLLADPAVDRIDLDVLVSARTASGRRGAGAGRAGSPACAASTPAGCATPRQVEALTANLIAINKRYKAHAGIRVTDV